MAKSSKYLENMPIECRKKLNSVMARRKIQATKIFSDNDFWGFVIRENEKNTISAKQTT